MSDVPDGGAGLFAQVVDGHSGGKDAVVGVHDVLGGV
jgi:hypothetical protein